MATDRYFPVESYAERKRARATKPAHVTTLVCACEPMAQYWAKHWRKAGKTARVFQRDIRADGLDLHVWVVVVRDRKGGASS